MVNMKYGDNVKVLFCFGKIKQWASGYIFVSKNKKEIFVLKNNKYSNKIIVRFPAKHVMLEQ